MKKNKNSLIILLVISSVLFLGLGGYIIYEKVINNDENRKGNIDNNKEITESDLREIIDKELSFLESKTNLDELSNQEKTRMVYDLVSDKSKLNLDIMEDYKKDSVLNKLDVSYTNIYGGSNGYELSDLVYKLNLDNSYVLDENAPVSGNSIWKIARLVDFKQEGNKYYASYKYAFYSGDGQGPIDLVLYPTYQDAAHRVNKLEYFDISEVDYQFEVLVTQIKHYFEIFYEDFNNKLDTYNYVFEMIDNKLTLVDFYVNNDGVNTSGNLLNLISEEDKKEIDDKTDYKNASIKIGDLKLNFDCTLYRGNFCEMANISLNNNVVHNYSKVSGDIDTDPYFIITDDSVIIHKKDSYTIDIYNKDGNKIHSINNVVYSFQKEHFDSSIYVATSMYLKNNKLYFMVYEKDANSEFSYHDLNKISLKYIDLSSDVYEMGDTNISFKGKISCKEC